MSLLISAREVAKNYKDQIVISRVSFELEDRQITILIGPNGAGKTTLAKIILGIELPTSGKIWRKPNINYGYLPQKLHFNINMPINVHTLLKVLSKNAILQEEVLNFTKVSDLLAKQVNELSGGQLQRTLIAANLMLKPDFLLLDEPMQGLDIDGQQDLYNLIIKIKENFGVSILLISHDLHTVLASADQVLCLNQHLCCHHKLGDDLTKLEETENLCTKLSCDTRMQLAKIRLYQHSHDHVHHH